MYHHILFDQCPQSELDIETVKSILAEYKIHNADITLRSDVTADDLIDVVEGNRYFSWADKRRKGLGEEVLLLHGRERGYLTTQLLFCSFDLSTKHCSRKGSSLQ